MTLLNSSIKPASIRRRLFAVIAAGALSLAVAGLLCLGSAKAQQGVSEIEVEEMKTALEVSRKQIAESQIQTEELEKEAAVLSKSLAESNRVAEETRAQYEELLLRMAALGVDLVKPSPKSLEQRLLQAVRDREQAEEAKQALANQLAALSEAVVGHLQTVTSSNPQAQAQVEAQLASASEVLGRINRPASTSARSMVDGQVVSIDPEIGLIVLNVGRESGARIGMPISVKRDHEPVGTALVVEVRESITGALLQNVAGNGEVKVGDRIEPRADSL